MQRVDEGRGRERKGKRRRGENEGVGEGVIKSSNDLLIDEGPKLRPQIATEPENQSCVLQVCVGGPPCVEVSAQCSNVQPTSAASSPYSTQGRWLEGFLSQTLTNLYAFSHTVVTCHTSVIHAPKSKQNWNS